MNEMSLLLKKRQLFISISLSIHAYFISMRQSIYLKKSSFLYLTKGTYFISLLIDNIIKGSLDFTVLPRDLIVHIRIDFRFDLSSKIEI